MAFAEPIIVVLVRGVALAFVEEFIEGNATRR
jgi:hypothetical protein